MRGPTIERWMPALLVAALAALGPAAAPARAELFIDFLAGVSETPDTRVTVEDDGFKGRTGRFSKSQDFDPAATVGLRVGYWLRNAPLGFGVGLSYFEADGDEVDLGLYTLSPLLMARLKLAPTDDLPQGRVQPYAGIGFSTAIARGSFRVEPALAKSDDQAIGIGIGTDAHAYGLDVRAGVAFQLHGRIAVLAEYRLTWFDLHFEEDEGDAFLSLDDGTREVETDLLTHSLSLGLSLRF